MSAPLMFFHYHIAFKKFLKTQITNSFENFYIRYQESLKKGNEKRKLNRRNQLPTSNLVTHKSQNFYLQEMQTHNTLPNVEV